jgi:hypothetical protein
MFSKIAVAVLICWGWSQNVAAQTYQGLKIEVLVDGLSVPEYWHGGISYIEALKGKEYAIRVTNHLNYRGAVALSVDGLNTIDARHTTAYTARKWVLEPHESVVISGWQVNYHNARRFFFTTEEESYAKELGQTSDLGVISAVLFRERESCIEVSTGSSRVSPRANEVHSKKPQQEPVASSPSSNNSAGADRDVQKEVEVPRKQAMVEEYAATGIGRQVRHDVRWVHLDLDPTPVASLSFRYEFRPVLVRLGVLPSTPRPAVLERRQRATGFVNEGFCPNPR